MNVLAFSISLNRLFQENIYIQALTMPNDQRKMEISPQDEIIELDEIPHRHFIEFAWLANVPG